MHGDFLACSNFDLSARLEEIALPVLVIASDCDRMVPLKVSLKMAEKLPNSEFVSLENCGHFQHIEQTAKVAGEFGGLFYHKLRNVSEWPKQSMLHQARSHNEK